MQRFSTLILAVLSLAGMWLYVDRVIVGHQVTEAAAQDIPRGNLSDLYPLWLGSRELLLRGRNPYSSDLTRKIQAGYYGRPLEAARANDPKNQQAFAYPVYVAFLLAPTVKLQFIEVRRIFFWLLLGLTATTVLLWLRTLKWWPGVLHTAVITVLLFATFAVVQGLKLQQLSLLVAALMAGSLVLLVSGQLALSGVLLAIATIKPQLTVFLAVWLLLWAFSSLRARWKFAAAFFLTLAAMVLGGELLLPGWIRLFYAAIVFYRQYAASGPLLDQMLNPALGVILRVLIIAGLIVIGWTTRKVNGDSESFQLTTCLFLASTLLLIPLYPPHYQLLLLPGALLLLRNLGDLWRSDVVFRVLLVAAAVPLLWSWTSALVLAAASFFTVAVQKYWQVPLWLTVILPVPVTACLGLLAYKCTGKANFAINKEELSSAGAGDDLNEL